MITIETTIIKPENFPDGTLRLNISDKTLDIINSSKKTDITWAYDYDAELFILQCLIDKIRDINPTIVISLNLPYIPHARMDRAHSNNCFTLKTFCNLINSMNFDHIFVLNPHSDVSTALLNRVIVEPTKAVDFVNNLGDDNFIIMYPDAGAAKKFSSLIQKNYITANKIRDWKTGKIKDYHIVTNGIEVKDKSIVIVDDICSYGGTFYYAAKALKELGAGNIYLHVDHCENSVLEGDMIKSGLIKEIWTTDSIYTKGGHERIHVKHLYRAKEEN